jgi:hypothetical protein
VRMSSSFNAVESIKFPVPKAPKRCYVRERQTLLLANQASRLPRTFISLSKALLSLETHISTF